MLVVAPTGSGKTLAAFLWALDCLISGRIPCGGCRILYISPLRALNNDIQRNLFFPLEALRGEFANAGLGVPSINILTRSGDTPATERQRMVRHPPEILITTPESLNNLLTSHRGRSVLNGIRTVIVDEVHSVIGTKRGVHLITAVDRLVPLCGEFQRIALSATVEPPERVAMWFGGYQLIRSGGDSTYCSRKVVIARSSVQKHYALRVACPPSGINHAANDEKQGTWSFITQEAGRIIERNRSTLFFANSKAMVEKLARFINESGIDRVFTHHGALSRETRALVEQRFKEGSARCLVATNSLELGIDIGVLDEVVLVKTPPSVASAIQRIGRAGHCVGDVSRATFLPLVGLDIIDAAVVARSVLEGAIEPVRCVNCPLDVLAQIIVSMTTVEKWSTDSLHAFLRTSSPYHCLSRSQLESVIEMLAGRYAETRIRELRPLLSYDRVDGTLRARRGSDLLVYMSGGTIPDRGSYKLRHADTAALLGELDEEFVWERSIGDTFSLGVQSWRIERITHNDVLVRPARHGASMAAFWRGETRDRSFQLAQRVGTFLENAESRITKPEFAAELRTKYCFNDDAVVALTDLLERQKRATAGMLPHRSRIIVEHSVEPCAQDTRGMIIIHAGWGGAVHRPFMMALQAAWEQKNGVVLQGTVDEACVAFESAETLRAEDIFSMVVPETVEELVRLRLSSTGFFGARFREAAGRALLLPKQGFNHRNPLWLTRARGKKLLSAVAAYNDFPMVLEAWRECMEDSFDIPALKHVLEEIGCGKTKLYTVATSTPSPFAQGVGWREITSLLMYSDDTPNGAQARTPCSALDDAIHSARLRPRIPKELIVALERKLKRTEVGWSPRTESDLLDWIVERVIIPIDEWSLLRKAMLRDHNADMDTMVSALGAKVLTANVGAPREFITAAESVSRWWFAVSGNPPKLYTMAGKRVSTRKEWYGASRKGGASSSIEERLENEHEPSSAGLSSLLADILRFYGPVPLGELAELLGRTEDDVQTAVDALVEAQKVVVDQISENASGAEVCDCENLERLLRAMRARSRPTFDTLSVSRLSMFLASWQRLAQNKRGVDGVREALDVLVGLPIACEMWETEVLPARVESYNTAWLDEVFAETSVVWFGSPEKKLSFAPATDRELFVTGVNAESGESSELETLIPHPEGRFTFDQMLKFTTDSAEDLSKKLWSFAWKGRLTSDGFQTVRRGINSGFGSAVAHVPFRSKSCLRRGRLARGESGLHVAGSWYRLADIDTDVDVLRQDEADRDRVRVLLDRWGVLFRQLLDREAPALRWGKVFRALRIMELSGEVLSGQFFEGINGLQFAKPEAVETLRGQRNSGQVVWFCAADPVSLSGLGLNGLEWMPRRLSSNHVAFVDDHVAVVSESNGKRLAIHLEHDNPALPRCFGFMSNLIERQVQTVKRVTVELINGEAASRSAYRGMLSEMFHCVGERGTLKLMRKYQ